MYNYTYMQVFVHINAEKENKNCITVVLCNKMYYKVMSPEQCLFDLKTLILQKIKTICCKEITYRD